LPTEFNGGVMSDAPLDLVAPLWQSLIGVCVLAVIVVSAHRLLMRGPSRMSRALVVTGGAIVALVLIGILLATHP
jgi:hypothetical protein